MNAAPLLLSLILAASFVPPARADLAIDLRPGAFFTHVLPANPSTGYTWRIDPAKSENLAILTIEDLGHAAPALTPAGQAPRVGAPQAQSFKITAKAPGTAKIAFAYARPWETNPPAQHETLTLTVR